MQGKSPTSPQLRPQLEHTETHTEHSNVSRFFVPFGPTLGFHAMYKSANRSMSRCDAMMLMHSHAISAQDDGFICPQALHVHHLCSMKAPHPKQFQPRLAFGSGGFTGKRSVEDIGSDLSFRGGAVLDRLS